MKMHKYFFSNSPAKDVTIFPRIGDDVKPNFLEIVNNIELSATHAKSKIEYPNGLTLEVNATIDGAEITTNWVIIKGVNGQLCFAEPISEIE